MSPLCLVAPRTPSEAADNPLDPSRHAAFDAVALGELSDMIGVDGVIEMIAIFEAETRQRLRRVAAADQSIDTLIREMHTLKGAASTVAASRLSALGLALEAAARQGIAPTVNDLATVAAALEEWSAAVSAWSTNHVPVGCPVG